MNNAEKKITDFSVWDSVVKDRIIQFEDLDRKYRSKCRKVEALTEENGQMRARMEETSAMYNSICEELCEKDVQIRKLTQEVADLKQWIANMENSTCWKLTKPIRLLTDCTRGKRR